MNYRNTFGVVPRAYFPQETFPFDYYNKEYVPNILDQRGNTPGFPAEMRYREFPRYWKEHCNPEYIDIKADGAEIVRQVDTQKIYIGDNYTSMVSDVPFDPYYNAMLTSFLQETNYFSEDDHKYYPVPHSRYTSYY